MHSPDSHPESHPVQGTRKGFGNKITWSYNYHQLDQPCACGNREWDCCQPLLNFCLTLSLYFSVNFALLHNCIHPGLTTSKNYTEEAVQRQRLEYAGRSVESERWGQGYLEYSWWLKNSGQRGSIKEMRLLWTIGKCGGRKPAVCWSIKLMLGEESHKSI